MPRRERDQAFASEIGARLRRAIDGRGASQYDVATAAGVSPSQLNRWVQGRTTPTPEHLAGLCAQLRISSDWLLGLEGGARTASTAGTTWPGPPRRATSPSTDTPPRRMIAAVRPAADTPSGAAR